MADDRKCRADELAGYHLGLEVFWQTAGVINRRGILVGVYADISPVRGLHISVEIDERGEHKRYGIARDTIVTVTP